MYPDNPRYIVVELWAIWLLKSKSISGLLNMSGTETLEVFHRLCHMENEEWSELFQA